MYFVYRKVPELVMKGFVAFHDDDRYDETCPSIPRSNPSINYYSDVILVPNDSSITFLDLFKKLDVLRISPFSKLHMKDIKLIIKCFTPYNWDVLSADRSVEVLVGDYIIGEFDDFIGHIATRCFQLLKESEYYIRSVTFHDSLIEKYSMKEFSNLKYV
jgi:hypothetical protein